MHRERNWNNLKILLFVLAAALGVFILYSITERTPVEKEKVGENAVLGGTFEINEYLMDVTVGKDHSYDVKQKISVTIPQATQNIQLTIPSGNFRVYDVDVENTAHYADIGTESSSIVIVDPFKLTEGKQTYNISYTIREFEDQDYSKDIFYFDTLPPNWKQPIGKVDIKLTFPDDFPWDDMQCYAGQFGVQDVNNKVEFKADGKKKVVTVKGEKVPENYGITIKAELPDGYWKGSLNGSWVIIAITAVMGGMLAILALLWIIGGRDPKVEKTTETKPIEGIIPAEIGYIFNGEVGIRDILQLLIYFARKGYLSITEYEPKRYKLTRGEDPVDEEKLYRNAFNILFEDVYKNRSIEMEDLGERLLRIRNSIKDDIAAGHASADASPFTPKSRIFRMVGLGLLALSVGVSNALTYRYEYLSINYIESILCTGILAGAIFLLCRAIDRRESSSNESSQLMEILSAMVIIGVIAYVSLSVFRRTYNLQIALGFAAASLFALFFILIMRARGKDNAALVMKVRRLRDFIYHPTNEILIDNYKNDPNYYYDMLQYALSSGAEESWASYFQDMNVPEPEWYSDEVEGHAYSNLREELTTLDYARDIKAFMRTMEAAFVELQRRRHRR